MQQLHKIWTNKKRWFRKKKGEAIAVERISLIVNATHFEYRYSISGQSISMNGDVKWEIFFIR